MKRRGTGPGPWSAALLLSAVTSPVAAQAPLDLFGVHSGAIRAPAVSDQQWVSFSAMLLTEFDGRFEDPEASYPPGTNPPLVRHDGLQTSVGYNYLTYGRNWVVDRNAEQWWPWLPRGTAFTVAVSGHLGLTRDSLVLAGSQTALHDFRGVTHNYRPDVVDGFLLVGADVQALFWPETSWLAFGPQLSLNRHYQEIGGTLILSDRVGPFRSQLAVSGGRILDIGTGPGPVAQAMDDGYLAVQVGVHNGERYGLSVGWDQGLFPGEQEVLLSLFVGVQLPGARWLRIEFVNDLLGGKDRGLTGGGRIVLAF